MAKPALIPTSPKAVIYARVSSKEQEREGFSIPAQLKLLREYAERKGLPILQEYTDVETAKKSGRTQFTDMVKFFKTEGRKKKDSGCRILLVEKTDRLYRNFKDYVTLDELALDIHLVKENDILSPNSRSHQKLLHGIKVVMAKNYIDNLSEEIKKGMQEKAEQGLYPSFAPLGYVNVICNGKKFIQPDPDMAPLVQKLFQWYATGRFSLLELTKKIHEEGLISRRNGLVISRGTIAKVLNNSVLRRVPMEREKLSRHLRAADFPGSICKGPRGARLQRQDPNRSPQTPMGFSGLGLLRELRMRHERRHEKGKVRLLSLHRV